ncbi:MAG: hypothetical protein ACJA0B_002127 [Alcanivorax borkumensis]|jgi:hypothetical protein|uniref:hypothetical protein n=1 Tax=Alcanivorax borkumensis TaxID=59754 RepID=UPI003EEB44E6
MSKCKPSKTPKMEALESAGVILEDITTINKDSQLKAEDAQTRNVVITIPYEALRDNKDVQIALQDLVYISTTP